MTDMKWSNKSSNYIMYQDLVDDEDDEIVAKPKDQPTLSTIENNVIVLPPIILLKHIGSGLITLSILSITIIMAD